MHLMTRTSRRKPDDAHGLVSDGDLGECNGGEDRRSVTKQ